MEKVGFLVFYVSIMFTMVLRRVHFEKSFKCLFSTNLDYTCEISMTVLQINRKCHESTISIEIINDDQTLVFFIKSVAFKYLAFQAIQEQPNWVAARLRVHDSFSYSMVALRS